MKYALIAALILAISVSAVIFVNKTKAGESTQTDMLLNELYSLSHGITAPTPEQQIRINQIQKILLDRGVSSSKF